MPSRPQTLPHFAHVDALRPGVDYYEQLFTRFLQRSSKREQIDLAAWFQHVKRGRVHVATACSGTDVPLLVYHGLRKAVMRVLGIPLELVHLFSCERSPAKQAFLRTMYEDMPTLFSDATQIGMPVAHDQISQKMQPVPEVDHSLLVGWPCTDVSMMNKFASTLGNRSCVLSGTLRTGGVFRGVVDFCKCHAEELDFLGSENVPALAKTPPGGGPDNLTAAVWLLDTECDMWTKPWVLNPMLFGVPQNRDRLWFPSYRRKSL